MISIVTIEQHHSCNNTRIQLVNNTNGDKYGLHYIFAVVMDILNTFGLHINLSTQFTSWKLQSICFYFTDEFRSKVACENEVIQLVCNPFSRIAIYSASYGRTEYESIQCTQPQGVKEESKYLHDRQNVLL